LVLQLELSISEIESYERVASRVRRSILEMITGSGASHIGTSFSMVELLVVLYESVLDIEPDDVEKPDRDRFLLSKGHGCAALYAVLAEFGFIPSEWLDDFYQNGSYLFGHATHKTTPGIEVSTGSLGHGLPMATGMALAAKRTGRKNRIFTMLSDGECDEGSVWEAALFAGHHQLDNMIAIIDYNKIQSLGRTADVLDLEPFADKWESFGWDVISIDRHDVKAVHEALIMVPSSSGKPLCVIAHTIKGKGVSFMENNVLWHYRTPDQNEYEAAMAELK